MFILTNGKNYVMENPMKHGTYISTTSAVQAKEFTWKQEKSLLNNKKKAMSCIRTYYAVNQVTRNIDKGIKYSKGNGGSYIGENHLEFDESIIQKIYDETASIIGLAGWSLTQLKTY